MSRKIIKRRSREEWRAIIVGQEASGKTVSEYCRHENLNEKSFYGWRKRPKLNAGPKLREFIRVDSARDRPAKVLTIRTPGGYRLDVPEGAGEAYVKTILRVLAATR